MGRVLQCLVCITAMTAVSQGDIIQRLFQFPLHSAAQDKNSFSSPIAENLTRTLEARKHDIENGTHSQKVKRGIRFDEPIISKECRKNGFCLEVEDYPEEDAIRLIKEGKATKLKERSGDEIGHRIGGDTNEVEYPLCGATQKTIYPKSLPDEADVYHTVLNPDGYFMQGFFVEICNLKKDGNATSCNALVGFPDHNRGACKQKHIFKLVQVIEKVNGIADIVQKELKLPGCCVCVGYRLP